MNATELYRAGRVNEAIDAAQQDVKRQPAETGKRLQLAQLLLFAGQWSRADKQLEVVSMQDPEMAVGIALLRQLVRGEVARQQFFDEGRSPSFLKDDDPLVRLHLEAAVAIRDQRAAEAVDLLRQSEEQAISIAGNCNDKSFVGLRDLDDLLGPVLEAITPNGKYYWINMNSVCSIEFHKPEQLHDLVWRRATTEIQDGPQGDVYVPVLYGGSHAHEDELIRLGRKTDWTAEEPVRGVGQRELLVGEEAVPVMEIERLTLSSRS